LGYASIVAGRSIAGIKRYLGLGNQADGETAPLGSSRLLLIFASIVAGFVVFGLIARHLSDDARLWLTLGIFVLFVLVPRLRDRRRTARGRDDDPAGRTG